MINLEGGRKMRARLNRSYQEAIFNLLQYHGLNIRLLVQGHLFQRVDLPNNETGYERSHEGISQDGADVSEEMSLRETHSLAHAIECQQSC